MKFVMTLADQTLNDLALFAVLVAFAAVLVVAGLWTAAHLRVDRILELAALEVGPKPKAAVAGVMTAGTLAVLLGIVPSHLLLDPWVATAAAMWVMATLVAVSTTLSARRRAITTTAATNAQELHAAKAA
jgi:hypothetical protein